MDSCAEQCDQVRRFCFGGNIFFANCDVDCIFVLYPTLHMQMDKCPRVPIQESVGRVGISVFDGGFLDRLYIVLHAKI